MKVTIVGLGLIGGSIGLGIIESGLAAEVLGFDLSEEARTAALKKKCVHSIIDSFDQAADTDIWVIATPPSHVPSILNDLLSHLHGNASVTDCASTKTLVLSQVPEGMKSQFVGGHPMAGHHTSGLSHARAHLFRDAAWILTPTEHTSPKALQRVESLAYALDAKPVHMSAEEHDKHVALLSHLPHALATLLLLQSKNLTDPGIAGSSWSDLTRIGGSNPALWREIFESNSECIAHAISDLQRALKELTCILNAHDGQKIQELFEEARKMKRHHH